MPKTQVQSLGWEDPLEKEMATHASILAWEISWKKEPSGLQFMGSQESDTTMTKQQQQSTGSRKPLQQIIIVRGGTKGWLFWNRLENSIFRYNFLTTSTYE